MRFQGLNESGGVRGFLLNLVAVFLVLALAFFGLRHFWEKPSAALPPQPTPAAVSTAFNGDPAEATDRLLKTLNQKLQDMDLLKLLAKDVETKPATVNGKVFPAYVETFRLPLRYSADQIRNTLAKAVEPLGAQVADMRTGIGVGAISNNTDSCAFTYNSAWMPVEIDLQENPGPKICLIIDDGGYQRGKALEALYGFKVPVTVSIIPDVQFSKSLAEEFPDHGVEVMCHMPMEGHEKGMVGANYKELLKKGMDDDQAKAKVEKALENLPNCRGLNNHMGSVATEDPALMADVCEVLKDHGLFVIDSRTTAKSVVEEEAKKTGIPVASRNVFLDNVETSEAILKQLSQAVSYAKRHGLAVAIGHFKPMTLQTLEAAIPRLKEEGIQFVYASEVVRDE